MTIQATITLKKYTGYGDQENSFAVDVKRKYPTDCVLMQDYEKKNDGIYWFMQKAAMIKSNYTDADRAERQRLNTMTPIKNGDVVAIEGETDLFEVKVLGDYSNTAILKRIA